MISEIFILSSKVNVVAAKSYRFTAKNSDRDVFMQKLRESPGGQVPPHFKEDDTYFYNIRRHGLYFVATSHCEQSPIFVIEILIRIYQTCKDFCGSVNEEAVTANSLLVFEILEEVLDFGYVQLASSEKLRPYIQTDPVVIKSSREPTSDISSRVFGIETRFTPGSSASKPFVSLSDTEGNKNEIFVDVIERITAVMNSNGTVTRLEVSGSINMKNFLSGNPEVRIGLNEDLAISKGETIKAFGEQVQLDNCNFHHKVQLTEFRDARVLILQPPAGELSVMTYTVSGNVALSPPFRVLPFLSDAEGSRDLMMSVRLKNETPSETNAVCVSVNIPVPHSTTSISQHLRSPGQKAEFNSKDKKIVWKIKEIPGQTELVAQFRLINHSGGKMNRQEVGPISVDFEISKYTCSGLKVKFVKAVVSDQTNQPQRWVVCWNVQASWMNEEW